jgi:hypothetical protein
MFQVGLATQSIWQAAQLATRHPRQTGPDDRARRSTTSVAGERHVPDVQHGERIRVYGHLTV